MIKNLLVFIMILLIQTPVLRAETVSWQALKSEGDQFLRKGLSEAAAGKYKAALSINPGCADAWFNLAIASYALGDAENTIRALEQLTSLKPDDAEAFYNLGCLYLYCGRIEEAKQCFRKVKTSSPEGYSFLDLSKRGLEFAESLNDSPSQGLILYLLGFSPATALPLQSTDDRLRA